MKQQLLLMELLICDGLNWSLSLRRQQRSDNIGSDKSFEQLHPKSEWGIPNGYQFVDSTYYGRNERYWPGGSQ
jgi:hypothetical protein